MSVYSDITLMSYKNSAKYKKNNKNTNIQYIKDTNNIHTVDYKSVIKNLKQENNELKNKLTLIIEKDKQIYEITIKLEKCKNIIAKYDLDEKKNHYLENKFLDVCDKLTNSNKIIKKLILKFDDINKQLITSNKLNELLKQKFIDYMNEP